MKKISLLAVALAVSAAAGAADVKPFLQGSFGYSSETTKADGAKVTETDIAPAFGLGFNAGGIVVALSNIEDSARTVWFGYNVVKSGDFTLTPYLTFANGKTKPETGDATDKYTTWGLALEGEYALAAAYSVFGNIGITNGKTENTEIDGNGTSYNEVKTNGLAISFGVRGYF